MIVMEMCAPELFRCLRKKGGRRIFVPKTIYVIAFLFKEFQKGGICNTH